MEAKYKLGLIYYYGLKSIPQNKGLGFGFIKEAATHLTEAKITLDALENEISPAQLKHLEENQLLIPITTELSSMKHE